jgi:hypothetical protein
MAGKTVSASMRGRDVHYACSICFQTFEFIDQLQAHSAMHAQKKSNHVVQVSV